MSLKFLTILSVCFTAVYCSSACHSKRDSFCSSTPSFNLDSIRIGVPGLDAHLPSPPQQHPNSHARKCAQELEQIIYSPPNPVRDYMLRIAREVTYDIVVKGAALDSASTLKIMAQISDRYDVAIEIQAPFANIPNILIQPGNSFSMAPRNIGQVIAATYLNQPGFQYDSKTMLYSLAIYSAGKDGTGFTVIVLLKASKAPQ